MHGTASKRPTEEYLGSIERLVFCVRFGPSNRQIEKGSVVGLYDSYSQWNVEGRNEQTVGQYWYGDVNLPACKPWERRLGTWDGIA